MIICPHAGLAFTFLLDEKSKQKNQEENKLPSALGIFNGLRITATTA